MGRVAELGCILCAKIGLDNSPACVHHVFDSAARSDFLVIPLCPTHHQGPLGYHGMGARAFERKYKTSEAELLAMTLERLA
jgi:hypothetical protein